MLSCPCHSVVIGPFSINGVPLRRVAQAYVIATQTKIEFADVNIPDELDDDYFRRSTSKGTGDAIFAESKQVGCLSSCLCTSTTEL